MRDLLEHSPAKLHARCGAAAGFSVQEPYAPTVTGRYTKTYWFDDHRWRQAQP